MIYFFYSTALFCQHTYYISSRGENRNSGLSPRESWRIIKELKPGNTYLLKRGDTLFFTINKVQNPTQRRIFIGAYGIGAKPVLSLYKQVKKNAWERTSDKIWRIDLSNTSNYSGFLNQKNTDVGFLKVGSQIKGNKVTSMNLLAKEWDFYSDERFLYVFTDNSPKADKNQILIATNYTIVQLSDSMEIADLDLCGNGGHAIQGVKVKNVKLRRITIREIGGSYLKGYRNGTTRYGNGIEFWKSADNCIVEKCDASQIYDAAFTMQSDDSSGIFNRIVFASNTANKNGQSFEFWNLNTTNGFRECEFSHNLCKNAGSGWSDDIRPDKNVGVHILNYFPSSGDRGMKIYRNTFIGARSAFAFLNTDQKKRITFKSSDNVIHLQRQVSMINNGVLKTNNLDTLRKCLNIEGKSSLIRTQ